MRKNQKQNIKDAFSLIAPILKNGGIGVIPTDTLYGIVGSAFKKETVERIYLLRKRDLKKPMIILISSLSELKKFDVNLGESQKKFLKKYWPGGLSVVLPCANSKMEYLHRGKKSLAFRMPANNDLLELLSKTGPLVAPSANLAGQKPAETYREALEYFKDNVDFYVDMGKMTGEPSTLIEIKKDGSVDIIREGRVKIA